MAGREQKSPRIGGGWVSLLGRAWRRDQAKQAQMGA